MNFVAIWIQSVREWIEEYLAMQRRKKLRILKEWHGKFCVVLKIDSDIPGCRAAYQIIPYESKEKEDWLVMLYQLAEFKAAVDGSRANPHTKISKRSSRFYRNHAAYRFAVYRLRRNGRSRSWCVYDVDLEGWAARSSTWAVLLPVQTVERALIKYIRKIPHEPQKTSDRYWHEQMKNVDWLGLLRMASKEVIGVDHNLREVIMWESKALTDKEFWAKI